MLVRIEEKKLQDEKNEIQSLRARLAELEAERDILRAKLSNYQMMVNIITEKLKGAKAL